MPLTAAERDARLRELLADKTIDASDALRAAKHAVADDPTNHALIDVEMDCWENVMCEFINRMMSLTGQVIARLDKRQTEDEQRLDDLEAGA